MHVSVRSAVARLARAASLVAPLLVAPLGLGAQPAAGGARPAARPACGAGPWALVLPGGGVKGIAHIGVIQVLDSLGIRPDLVVGTSMGAIVGALYASGWSGTEIEALAKRFPVASAVGVRSYFRTPRALGTAPSLLRWEQGDAGLSLDLGAADETRVNNLMSAMMLRGNLLARGDFDRLPIPFRAVAADMVTGKKVVLARGDLAEAVRTSFAIPLVFQPLVDSTGHPLVDGGIAENIPVVAAREAGARHVLVSQLRDTSFARVEPTGASIAARMMALLFEQNVPTLAPGDLQVESDVSGQSNLDFSDATIATMLARGRTAGRALVRDACLPRRPRTTPPLPPVARRGVVPATPRSGRALVEQWLGFGARGYDLDSVMTRLDRLSTAESVRAAWLNPLPKGDSVVFAPVVQLAPRRVIGAGLVFDADYGGRSWFGLVDRRLAGDRIEGALRGTLGEFRQDVEVNVRRALENPEYDASPFVSLLYGHEQVRLFRANGDELARSEFPDLRELVARAGWELPFGSRWRARFAGVARGWRGDALLRDTLAGAATRGAVGVAARLDGAWPTWERAAVADLEVNTRFVRLTAGASALVDLGRLKLTPTVRAGWMTRDAPLHLRLPLGEKDGFAGLRIGERLGTSQLYLASDVAWRTFGPIDVVVTPMVGTTSADDRRPLGGRWLGGVRLGLGAETPIGPLRLQHGWNDAGRSLWFLRLGRWF